MATIFPANPDVNDEYQGYKWDGTAWNIIGVDLTADYPEITGGFISDTVIPVTIARVSDVDTSLGDYIPLNTKGEPLGVAELDASGALEYAYGGTGLTTLGTAGQVLKVNTTEDGLEWGTGGGGGTSKVTKSSVSLGTIAVSSSWTEIEITDVAQRGIVSLIEITSNISGLYNFEVRSASGGSGNIMLSAEGIDQLYSATIPWYYEADTGNSMWIRIKNIGSSSMTFTLNNLRIEKFA